MIAPYVGRDAELAALRTAAARVEAGDSARVLVVGEAGIGKTRLISEFTAPLGADWLTVTGGCPELGAEHFPYVAFLPVVQQLVVDEGGAASQTTLRILLRQHPTTAPDEPAPMPAEAPGPAPPSEPAVEAPSGRLALLHELLALIERAASGRRLLLVVEDLHWADSASRELFGYLARNLGRLPVLLVGTVRTGELAAGHPVRQLVAELGRRPDIGVLSLEPLGQRDVGELLTAVDGRYDPARAAAIHRRSGGNPMFVEALAREEPRTTSPATGAGPSPLRTLLQERVARLSEAARPVLAVAAVAGASVSHDLLTLLADRPDGELNRALRELVEHEQLLPTASGYEFRHALMREAVYTGLLPGERRRLHARAASALTGRPDLATLGLPAAELAEHWHLAGCADEAYRAALVAADEARASFAYGAELRHLERALALQAPDDPARLELHERAIAAALPAGQGEQGLRHCAAALELVDAVSEPEHAALLLLDRAQCRSRLDLSGRADVERARELLPPDRPSYALGLLHYVLAIDDATGRYADSSREHARRVLELGELLDDYRLRCRGSAALGMAELAGDNLDAAEVAQARARRIATAIGDDFALVANSLWECARLGKAGLFEQLAAQAPVAMREAELLGMGQWRGPLFMVNLAIAQVCVGRWDDAVLTLEQALAEEPETLYALVLRLQLGTLSLWRGDLDRAAALMPTPEELHRGSPVLRNYLLGFAVSSACALAVARQDPESAGPAVADFLRHALSPEASPKPDQDALLGIAMLQRARLAAAPRNREIAADAASIRATLTGLLAELRPRAPYPMAYQATIAAALGPGRLADWDEATEHWRRISHVPGMIESLIAAAEAALAGSNRAGARRRLEEARDLATPLGAQLYLDRIAALGRRARLESPVTGNEADSGGLTPREYDVLRLLARGLPNRQIAAELFISPATVGVHVSRILTKLTATTRTEATARAHSLGLLD
ncbi:transcriptional regulator, LuxR family [Kribbella flavida DSM 17836]|uniref:Transcriptional regulator, LuxR family n=1 Tax=Kribbella flavida (strain DSM 17836 / JCM 10339 / NBRC 14399) TaxID=479435 RepID=D2PSG6_KRIFD|nr:transcriptional regulator, LuxR family [Kribbella flavida DSM 17836]